MIDRIMGDIEAAGGEAYFVGGFVRDRLRGVEPKDVDVEVFGVDSDVLRDILGRYGRVDAVGASFGVYKFVSRDAEGERVEADFSLPRRESKAGRGHRGFMVSVDGGMTPEAAAARRDFTMNSLYARRNGEIVDHYGGAADLENGVLRHTSAAFADDPLRVLRGMQFAARYDMAMADETVAMCRSLRDEYSTLARERVWGEWYKWASKGTSPHAGLSVLYRTRWITLYPEIAALVGVPQDREWHPEGSAYVHTALVCDAAARIAEFDALSPDERAELVFAALCHDFGKPATTTLDGGRIRAHGHAVAGVEPAMAFLRSIGAPEALVARVAFYTANHMAHTNGEMSDRALRRLAVKAEACGATLPMLARLIEADYSGRPPLPGGLPESARPLVEFRESVAPILMGRHLMGLGMTPGREMGNALRSAYEAQLDGEFSSVSGALAFVQARYAITD